MNEEEKKEAIRLSNEHWDYIESLLKTHEVDTKLIKIIEFHYKTSFQHGFKHGLEFRKK